MEFANDQNEQSEKKPSILAEWSEIYQKNFSMYKYSIVKADHSFSANQRYMKVSDCIIKETWGET